VNIGIPARGVASAKHFPSLLKLNKNPLEINNFLRSGELSVFSYSALNIGVTSSMFDNKELIVY